MASRMIVTPWGGIHDQKIMMSLVVKKLSHSLFECGQSNGEHKRAIVKRSVGVP